MTDHSLRAQHAAPLQKRSLHQSRSARIFLTVCHLLYSAARPLIFRQSAQDAHARAMALLRWLDNHRWAQSLLKLAHDWSFDDCPVDVGGVHLPHPLILAAGFVKGEGFASEDEARKAVEHDIIPGWRSMPTLVGAVEFGSFTRWPRLGNPGVVIWRDAASQSTQNRVGLKNPGAQAAAAFLAKHQDELPAIYGINLAVSPGVSDPQQEKRELLEALAAFLDRGLRPAWFTLNLSCPNTEDDPGSHQTESRARDLCAALIEKLGSTPLWVKISPDLADDQYRALLYAFSEVGVKAVVATNTLGSPAPDGTTAGIGGGRLRDHTLKVVALLSDEIVRQQYAIDLIACGGVEDGATFQQFAAYGVRAAQYWSALIYRGPLAAALIEGEV